jgi:hypothetical protein
MLSIKEKSNYLAKVVKLTNVRKHSNADRLQCVAIDGNNIITGSGAKDGDIVIYFPLECQINGEFLRDTNSYSDSTLNKDTSVKSYFPDTGRVRATKLRGEKSEGYIVPASLLQEWLQTKGISFSFESSVNEEFDTVSGVLVCNKYKLNIRNQQGLGNKVGSTKKKAVSRLIEGQYAVSEDTGHFKKNVHTFTPESKISISYKMHGCNFSMGKVLVKKKLSWVENLLKKFGVNIVDTEYDLIYASRSVIKNSSLGGTSEFTDDVWGQIAERYKDSLQDGITINGEIVGYTKQGAYIQKGYDYGLPEKELGFKVFDIKITVDSKSGFEDKGEKESKNQQILNKAINKECNIYAVNDLEQYTEETLLQAIKEKKIVYIYYEKAKLLELKGSQAIFLYLGEKVNVDYSYMIVFENSQIVSIAINSFSSKKFKELKAKSAGVTPSKEEGNSEYDKLKDVPLLNNEKRIEIINSIKRLFTKKKEVVIKVGEERYIGLISNIENDNITLKKKDNTDITFDVDRVISTNTIDKDTKNPIIDLLTKEQFVDKAEKVETEDGKNVDDLNTKENPNEPKDNK